MEKYHSILNALSALLMLVVYLIALAFMNVNLVSCLLMLLAGISSIMVANYNIYLFFKDCIMVYQFMLVVTVIASFIISLRFSYDSSYLWVVTTLFIPSSCIISTIFFKKFGQFLPII